MRIHKVMDQTGHSTLEFEELKAAQVNFEELLGKGYTAAKKLDNGSHEKVTSFNPEDTEVLFVPQLKGG